ncbi:hypothetical protein AB669_05460 [Pedobacter sp. BMA]|nr:hypothetical protein AB669_05460 [Pedobacter sp. BMA]
MLSIFFSSPSETEKKNTLRLGPNATIDNTTFGEHVSIGKNCYLYNSKIGSYTYLSQGVSIMNTELGKFCSIAQNVLIGGGMHPSKTFVSTSPVFYSLSKQCGTTFSDSNYFREMGKTTIGNDVWIGANVVVFDDVIIGDGAIIGAGSIVTKDVQPYSIVFGSPAKHTRFRFDGDEIKFLQKLEWWNKDEEWLKLNYKDFHQIKLFKKKYNAEDNS